MSRIEQLTQLLENQPEEPFLLFALAKEHINMGQPEEALGWFAKLEQTDPDYVGMYYHYGKTLQSAGQRDLATKVFARGIGKARQHGDFHALAELQSAAADLEYMDED